MRVITIRLEVPDGVMVQVATPEDTDDQFPPQWDLEPPTVTGVRSLPGGVCPIHRVPWRRVPAGVSRKTGRPYAAFEACPEAGCDQRPRAAS